MWMSPASTGISEPMASASVIAEVRGDDPELAGYLRIEERELEAGGLN
jgi:hypothetical protein